MYGLKQAAVLAYDHLKTSLQPFGYHPIPGTVGLWKHTSRPTIFCLCVDDFGIKYWFKQDSEHLLHSLSTNFVYTVDCEGKHYYGLTLHWEYKLGYVDISIPGYITNTLTKLNHTPSKSPQHSPHIYFPIQYGKKGTQQYPHNLIHLHC